MKRPLTVMGVVVAVLALLVTAVVVWTRMSDEIAAVEDAFTGVRAGDHVENVTITPVWIGSYRVTFNVAGKPASTTVTTERLGGGQILVRGATAHVVLEPASGVAVEGGIEVGPGVHDIAVVPGGPVPPGSVVEPSTVAVDLSEPVVTVPVTAAEIDPERVITAVRIHVNSHCPAEDVACPTAPEGTSDAGRVVVRSASLEELKDAAFGHYGGTFALTGEVIEIVDGREVSHPYEGSVEAYVDLRTGLPIVVG